jgi:hypothetical protein
MTSRRSNRVSHRIKPEPLRCRICAEDLTFDLIKRMYVREQPVCMACAIRVHEGLLRHYNTPEVTAFERIRHYNKHGEPRWRDEPAAQNDPGWVYYIRMGDVIKIGYAIDVTKRMRAYPPSAELLAAHPGTKAVERDMHKRFSEDLARGREWFRESDDLIAHIASVVEQFGDASKMSYQYTRPKTQEEKVEDMFKTRQHLEIARGVHSAV